MQYFLAPQFRQLSYLLLFRGWRMAPPYEEVGSSLCGGWPFLFIGRPFMRTKVGFHLGSGNPSTACMGVGKSGCSWIYYLSKWGDKSATTNESAMKFGMVVAIMKNNVELWRNAGENRQLPPKSFCLKLFSDDFKISNSAMSCCKIDRRWHWSAIAAVPASFLQSSTLFLYRQLPCQIS